ncbi:hypothetical protein B4U80_07140 [Leptotrombidium deliense]|uniref:Uncharacterized protein n=1 Tax=Leptotrombidium deliense TaxID=299467 RepID=A0A443SUK9_9ACAR|nr:hypothetical protein B4U80_07140 [Leptotrombidium deliense]
MELPKEAPSDNERPTKPFGYLLEMDNLSVITGDDRSLAGSIIIRPSDAVSLAQTSRTGSEVDERDLEERSLSLYDNVDVCESIEAAKRLSGLNISKGNTGSLKSSIEPKRPVSNSSGVLKSAGTPTESTPKESKCNNFSQSAEEIHDFRRSVEAITPTMENIEDYELHHMDSSNNFSFSKSEKIEFIDASGDSMNSRHSSNFECTFASVNNSAVDSSNTFTVENGNNNVNICTVEHNTTIYTSAESFDGVCKVNDVYDASLQHSSVSKDSMNNSTTANDFESPIPESECRPQRPTSLQQNDTPSRFVRKTSIPKLVKRRSPEAKNGNTVRESTPVTSPTSPPSLIPRYVTRSPSSASSLSSSSSKPSPNQRMHNNGNIVNNSGSRVDSPVSPNNEQNSREDGGGKEKGELLEMTESGLSEKAEDIIFAVAVVAINILFIVVYFVILYVQKRGTTAETVPSASVGNTMSRSISKNLNVGSKMSQSFSSLGPTGKIKNK